MSMLGTALYYFSIILDDGTMLNFRSIVYLLASYYGEAELHLLLLQVCGCLELMPGSGRRSKMLIMHCMSSFCASCMP